MDRLLLIGVPVLAITIIAILVVTRGGSGDSVQAQAEAVCSNAQRELDELPKSPASVAEAIELEHSGLTIFEGEVSELQVLGPRGDVPFRVGLADDRTLLKELSSMLARPDFVQLSLTLPHHPNLAPAWLKEWLARSRSLQADARTQFSQAGMLACEESLG
jgi:hypothetical protein